MSLIKCKGCGRLREWDAQCQACMIMAEAKVVGLDLDALLPKIKNKRGWYTVDAMRKFNYAHKAWDATHSIHMYWHENTYTIEVFNSHGGRLLKQESFTGIKQARAFYAKQLLILDKDSAEYK